MEDEGWEYKKHALAGYEAGSCIYDRLYGEEQEKKYERCSRYLSDVSGKLMLDCGCGTGTLLRKLAEQGGLFVGVDLSKNMLELARKGTTAAKNIDLTCADADNLPFKSGIFDCVVSFTMLGNLPDVTRTIRELERVASDSAQIILSFSKKRFGADDVLELLACTCVRVREFINEDDLKDWVAIAEKDSQLRSGREDTRQPEIAS